MKTHYKNIVDHPLYSRWVNMIARCHSDKNKDYHNYGGRGIKVCPEWRYDSRTFCESLYPTYKKGLTLDRKNVNLGYSPDNCRWIPLAEQANNRRYNVCLTHKGVTKNVAEWAAATGVPAPTIQSRMRKHTDSAIILAPTTPAKTLTYKGTTLTLNQWAERSGVHTSTIRNRLGKGWSICKVLAKPTKFHGSYLPKNTRTITFKNKTMTIAEWSAETGLHKETIRKRLMRELPTADVLAPVKKGESK